MVEMRDSVERVVDRWRERKRRKKPRRAARRGGVGFAEHEGGS